MDKKTQEAQKRQAESKKEETGMLEQPQDTNLSTEARVESTSSITPIEVAEQKKTVEAVEPKEEPILVSDEEKRVLLILNLIHYSGLRVTGFQIKDFLDLIFPGQDVDSIYWGLKTKQFISNRKDSDEFWLLPEGKKMAQEYKDLLDPLLERVAEMAIEALGKDELLERLLYLSYFNKSRTQNCYFPKVREFLAEADQIFATFFFSDDFQKLLKIEKIVRHLRKKLPSLVKEKLGELSRDPDFLKALIVLEMPQIAQSLGIEVSASIHWGDYARNLSLFLPQETRNRVVKELMLLGITESDNLFAVDIQAVMAKEEHATRIREWLAFAQDKARKTVEDDWDMFLDTRKCIEGFAPTNIQGFVKLGALLISKDKLLVRTELGDIYQDILNSIEHRLSERVKDFGNVVTFPFLQREHLKGLTEKIVVTVEVEDSLIGENELADNVVLRISPLEVGFKQAKQVQNREFNALGKLNNLEDVKSRFGECKWICEDESNSVQGAKQIIEDRKPPEISLDEAIDELKQQDPILLEILSLAATKRTYVTAIKRGYYKEGHMWGDVWSNISTRYPDLTKEEFARLQKKVKDYVEKRARINLLFISEEDIYQLCKHDLQQVIFDRVRNLDDVSMRVIYLYAYLPKFEDESRFSTIYQLTYGEKLEIPLFHCLLKVGLASTGTWISAKNKIETTIGRDQFLHEMRSDLLREIESTIQVEKPSLDVFKSNYRDKVTQLMGLDYILSRGGSCKMEGLRDFLWNALPTAWNEFESPKGIISSKQEDTLVVNPMVHDELKEFVTARKMEMLNEKESLRDLLLSLDNIDWRLDLNKELGTYEGYVTTPAKDKITILITPWYMQHHEGLLVEKTILVVTNQPDYESFMNNFRNMAEVALIFVEGQEFSIYSAFSDTTVIDSLVSKLGSSLRLKSKDMKKQKAPEQPSSLQPEMVKEEEPAVETKVEEEATGAGGSVGGEQEIDLFQKLFSIKGDFPGGVYSKPGPVVLILCEDDDLDHHHVSLQMICKEIYHERVGGLPSPKVRGETEDYIGEDLTAEKSIEFVENPLEFIDDPAKRDKIGNRLKEMYSQGFGFIIFRIPTSQKNYLVHNLKALTQTQIPPIIELSSVKKPYLHPTKPHLVPSDSEWNQVRRKIARSVWGFVLPKHAHDWQSGKTFDELFMACEREFHERMGKLLETDITTDYGKAPAYMVVNRTPSESDLHYAMKIFATKYLVDTRQYAFGSIQIEKKEELGIPDIKVDGKLAELERDIAIEVETLYGTGILSLQKVRDTIQKYRGLECNYEVWVILKNLDVLFFYAKLKRLQASVKKQWRIDVKFLTLDLENQELISIEKMRGAMDLESGGNIR